MTRSFAQQAGVAIESFWEAASGYGERQSPLDPCANAYEFVERYQFTFDGQTFDWHKYSHLIEVYEDDHDIMTLMAGAQSGKSLRLMVELLRQGIINWGSLLGYYFPDFFLPRAFSKERFRPFVASSELLYPWLGAESTKGKGTDAVLSRSFGPSTFFFLSVAGKTATEGLPMPGVFFDEVRRMGFGDVQRATKRTSSFDLPVVWKVSTALYPESDIHAAFLSGDQRFFHSACKCPDGVVLARRFPDCILDLDGATPQVLAKVAHAFSHAGLPYLGMTERERERYGEAVYLCPDCGTIITNPRDGWWEAEKPSHYGHSYHMPQLLTMPAARVWQEYAKPTEPLDIQEFWNSTLGLPYINEDARLATLPEIMSCVRADVDWPARHSETWRRENMRNTCMGIDQMGKFNCVVIKRREPNGKYRTVHLEVTYGDDTWKRCAELMVSYDVRVCVCDRNPNYNDSYDFARMFPGRVWLTSYAQDKDGKSAMVDWKDRKKAPEGQRQARDSKWKWDVTMNLRKLLEWSLGRFGRRENEIPHPRGLIQNLPVQNGKPMLTPDMRQGQWEPVAICESVYIPHLTRMVRRKEVIDEQHERRRDFKMVVEYVGSEDPHFVFANAFADAACARVGSNRR